ncbi:4-hydroxybenzoyl-CoA thioesterase [Serratia sp. Leaf50]|uniref:acyl-CoA thioesterase n=1 Tax=Rouxiella sp. S1S-2 TaxID=2653856 RepID=UPI0006FCC260|nr:thioesterase family protein [Rouxiella sp. S1S-2]KAB7895551.1 acyl-CoA thioesterase [Rouxiella sp. S1S-2]KQN44096.1 4-hydroxybenzoyl-CoA thioesterase [Serratia sp. Leaf50]
MAEKKDPRLSDPRFTTRIEITVPFHDVDSMGVVWHGNYFRYLEIAREALLKQFGYGYREMEASGYVWPIVDTRVKYIGPVTFEQTIIVQAEVQEFENRLRIGYQIFDALTGKRTTRGFTLQVAVSIESKEMCFASPAVLFEKMGVSQ